MHTSSFGCPISTCIWWCSVFAKFYNYLHMFFQACDSTVETPAWLNLQCSMFMCKPHSLPPSNTSTMNIGQNTHVNVLQIMFRAGKMQILIVAQVIALLLMFHENINDFASNLSTVNASGCLSALIMCCFNSTASVQGSL